MRDLIYKKCEAKGEFQKCSKPHLWNLTLFASVNWEYANVTPIDLYLWTIDSDLMPKKNPKEIDYELKIIHFQTQLFPLTTHVCIVCMGCIRLVSYNVTEGRISEYLLTQKTLKTQNTRIIVRFSIFWGIFGSVLFLVSLLNNSVVCVVCWDEKNPPKTIRRSYTALLRYTFKFFKMKKKTYSSRNH